MATRAQAQEYALSAAEYKTVVRLIREYAGIALAETKQHLVYGRLSRRLRALKMTSFSAYLDHVQEDAREREEFCNALTTNLTSFFRENHHFEFLAKKALPELMRRNAASRRLRIWSAGCSTGEEPYSIAMTVLETLGAMRDWDIRILATDLDSQVLAHSAAGVYSEDRFEKMSPARMDRWFKKSKDGGFHVADDELKRLIAFKQLNLIEPWPMKGPFDIVFCRNVIIYFAKETQQRLFTELSRRQNQGHYLLIGHSESLFNVTDDYELLGQTIYRKAV